MGAHIWMAIFGRSYLGGHIWPPKCVWPPYMVALNSLAVICVLSSGRI